MRSAAQVGPLTREDQRLDEQGEAIGSNDAIDECARVGLGHAHSGRRLLSMTGDMEHVAAGSLDKHRLLGAEVVSDLAWKGVGRTGNRGDGSAVEAACLKECACRIEKARAHALAGGTRGTRAVAG